MGIFLAPLQLRLLDILPVITVPANAWNLHTAQHRGGEAHVAARHLADDGDVERLERLEVLPALVPLRRELGHADAEVKASDFRLSLSQQPPLPRQGRAFLRSEYVDPLLKEAHGVVSLERARRSRHVPFALFEVRDGLPRDCPVPLASREQLHGCPVRHGFRLPVREQSVFVC